MKSHALFLDMDGTLLEIAHSPDAVVVPEYLTSLLAHVSSWLGGALAIVSGRKLDDLDNLLSPLRIPCAGEHGAILRLPNGAVESTGASCSVPQSWRTGLAEAAKKWPGVLVEQKSFSVALHYRMAPERQGDVLTLARSIVAQNERDFEVLSASMAYEIRNRKLNKAEPVHRLMTMAPFKGRTPIFVGDDITDRDGFRAALSFGGLALDVHEDFAGKPGEVLRWLKVSGTR